MFSDKWCPVCTGTLTETEKDVVTGLVPQLSLVHLKYDGVGLLLPSPIVTSVYQETVQRMLKTSGENLPKGRGWVGVIATSMLEQ